MFIQKLNYIHYNPVAHGFVTKEEDYPWSSQIIPTHCKQVMYPSDKLCHRNCDLVVSRAHVTFLSLQEDCITL